MFINIIFSFIYFIFIICAFATYSTASTPNNNIIFGVTLPSDIIKNEEIKKLSIKYKKLCRIFILISFITFLPILIIKYISLTFIYFFIWIIFFMFIVMFKPLSIINKELLSLKKQNNWFSGNTRELTIDTSASLYKNKKAVSVLWFLGAAAIPLILLIIELLNSSAVNFSTILLYPLIDLTLILIFLTLYYQIRKLKIKTYSENSNINIALNCERQRL